jgi:hypothetical protein
MQPSIDKTPCMTCREAVTSVNGRYCRRLKIYVEYSTEAPCLNKTSNISPK